MCINEGVNRPQTQAGYKEALARSRNTDLTAGGVL